MRTAWAPRPPGPTSSATRPASDALRTCESITNECIYIYIYIYRERERERAITIMMIIIIIMIITMIIIMIMIMIMMIMMINIICAADVISVLHVLGVA